MANRNNIINKISSYKNLGQDIIRREYFKKLHEYTKNDTIIYIAEYPYKKATGSASRTSIGLDDISGFMTCLENVEGGNLDLIIHSPGGSIEATEQIVQYLRSKYSYIRAIIPQNAMSAATMLACACDEIVMGKQSAIGPIDPQMALPGKNQMTLPAHSILSDFERAKSEIAENPETARVWIPKLIEIPNGFLDLCEKSIELSESKVADWLDSYMFKNETEKPGKIISKWLCDFDDHMTHARPINYELAREKGLKITLLEDDPELQENVMNLFMATMVTFDVTLCIKMIENHLEKGSFTFLEKS